MVLVQGRGLHQARADPVDAMRQLRAEGDLQLHALLARTAVVQAHAAPAQRHAAFVQDVEDAGGIAKAGLQLQVDGHFQQVVVGQGEVARAILQMHGHDAAVLAAEALGDPDRLRLAFAQGLGVDAEQVLLDHFLRTAKHRHAPGLQQDRALAERTQGVEVVADEQQGGAARQDLLDARHRLGLERGIADRQCLVDDQDVGVDVHLHRERQAQCHAGAVGLDRLVDVVADVGEGDDVIEQGVDARRGQAQDRAVDVDVLAPGQFRVEAGTQLKQCGHAAMRFHPA